MANLYIYLDEIFLKTKMTEKFKKNGITYKDFGEWLIYFESYYFKEFWKQKQPFYFPYVQVRLTRWAMDLTVHLSEKAQK